MKAVLIACLSLILLVLALVVARGLFYGAQYALAAAVSGAHRVSMPVGGAGPHMHGPYTVSGTVVYDDGYPPAPYIQYQNARHATSTKQLVFYGARACNPSAGDIPCVPPYETTDGYPAFRNGDPITVTGYMYEDRFLITP